MKTGETPSPLEAQILELHPIPHRDGWVTFHVTNDTKGRDVLATIGYVHPRQEE
jgi:hypothetical protein